MKKLLFIVGPTASGKSDFAVQVAKMLKTDVISSDSMQIYKDMTCHIRHFFMKAYS